MGSLGRVLEERQAQGECQTLGSGQFRWDQGLRGKGGGGQCRIVGLRAGGQRAREHHRGGVGWAALKHWEDRDHGATSLPRGGGVKKTPQRVEAEGNGVGWSGARTVQKECSRQTGL